MAAATTNFDDSIFDGFRQGRTSRDFWLPRILALAASVIGPLPLILDVRWGVPMSTIGPIFWLVSILLVIGSVALARRAGDQRFVSTVIVALLAGYMATATYDSSRVAGISAGVIDMDEALGFGMRLSGHGSMGDSMGDSMTSTAHGSQGATPPMADSMASSGRGSQAAAPAMGSDAMAPSNGAQKPQAGHAGKPESVLSRSRLAIVALGYAWHYWSGIMFSLAFLVLFGARGWKWSIPFLVLVFYPGMLLAMPSTSFANFIWEGLGHAGFGLTLGIVSSALLSRG
ncbi:hypothetical protein OVY48_06170 [Sphingobium sp. SA2]|uniref:hypothetical protein n=1 Tax=Sphingobium sp. SA2 TaxID=1524832 RepID=UPI0028BF869F|nr:hypothetical protein [Sphingobium sp. SA2]MDT7533023.1 hypothetical protein [Sphingobium sp. SA2]